VFAFLVWWLSAFLLSHIFFLLCRTVDGQTEWGSIFESINSKTGRRRRRKIKTTTAGGSAKDIHIAFGFDCFSSHRYCYYCPIFERSVVFSLFVIDVSSHSLCALFFASFSVSHRRYRYRMTAFVLPVIQPPPLLNDQRTNVLTYSFHSLR